MSANHPGLWALGVILTCTLLAACSPGRGERRSLYERGLAKNPPPVTGKWAIAVHGGAGMLDKSMPHDERAAYRTAMEAAREAGVRILDSGGSALDAVEAAVRVLEDDERFNAGRGAVLTRDGACELDASIMDGRTLACGAVAGARTVKNPISFARRIMQETPHILFAGVGAERLADQMNVERVPPTYFITPKRQKQLEEKIRTLREAPPAQSSPSRGLPGGTVGAVALDTAGNLAAATSTGGMTAKMPGRIGDSPIIGAGCYANNATLAVSCTGTGEQFIRHAAAHELSSLVRYARLPLHEAARTLLNERLDPDDGGLIAVSRTGEIVMPTTTGCMPRASADSAGRREFGLWVD